MPDQVFSSLLTQLVEYQTSLEVRHEEVAAIDPDVADLLAELLDEVDALIEVLEAIEDESGRWSDMQMSTQHR